VAEGESRTSIGSDVLVAGTAGLLGLLGPDIAIAAAFASPVAASAAKNVLGRIEMRKRARQEGLFELTARILEVGVEELSDLCESDPELEELLIRVLEAAADTATREKLVTYALALANGVRGENPDGHWESTFVDVIHNLGPNHLELLDRFTRTSNELGLGDGSQEFDSPLGQLNDVQIELVAKDLPALRSILAVLQRDGLLDHRFVSGGGFIGVSTTSGLWELTDFGTTVHDVLKELGRRLAPA